MNEPFPPLIFRQPRRVCLPEPYEIWRPEVSTDWLRHGHDRVNALAASALPAEACSLIEETRGST